MATKLKIGERVWWTDPDAGACSCAGTVTKLNGETVTVATEAGELECPPHELKRYKALKKFSVDIQHTEEFTYQVEAPTLKAAEALAMARYGTGDDEGEHSEMVGDPTITNSEQIRA